MQYAASLVCLLLFLSLGVLLLSESSAAVIIFAIFQGLAAGFFSVCNGVLWPNYFGTEHIASIRGLSMTATVVGSALGPLPLGLVFDIYGDYTIALFIMMAFAFAGICAALLSPKPRLREINCEEST
jgi:MFS family permease